MANTLTGLIPTMYTALQQVAAEMTGIIGGAARDATMERLAKGSTVRSPIAPAVTASDITPGVTAPNDGDQVFSYVDLTLDKSRYVPIRWNGEEQLALAAPGGPQVNIMLRNQFAQAYRALVNEVEVDLFTKAYKAASRAYGTAGTTPFGTANDLSDFAGVAQILDDNGAPRTDRHLALSTTAMANIRGKQSVLFKANEAGTDELLRQGTVGRVEGFDLHPSAAVKQVTKGTGSGYLVNNASGYAVGATTIAVDTGTGTILAGDVITFTGDANKYVVASALSGGSLSIASPGLRQAVADNVAITVGNSYVPNIAFVRGAVILATRAPAMPVDANGNAMDDADDVTIVQEPNTGIAFQVALYRQYRQIKYEVGLAWGTGAVNPEQIALLLG